jgi:hypothetical protein
MFVFRFSIFVFLCALGTYWPSASAVFAQTPSFVDALKATAAEKEFEKYSFEYTMYEEAYRDEGRELVTAVHEEGSIAGIPGRGVWLTRRGRRVLDRKMVSPVNAEEREALGKQELEKRDDNLWTYSLCRDNKVITTSQSTNLVRVSELITPIAYPTVPFDFRLLGIGSYGDCVAGKSFEDVLEFWGEIGKKMPGGIEDTLGGEPVVSYDAGSHKFVVDYQKGSSFVFQRQVGYKKVLGGKVSSLESETEVKLKLEYDHWVPSYAKVRSKSGFFEIYFTWIEPKNVNDKMFTLDYVRTLMQADKAVLEQNQNSK